MRVISEMVRQTADTPQAHLTRLEQNHPGLMEDGILELIVIFQAGLDK
jgi:hypothetical protein